MTFTDAQALDAASAWLDAQERHRSRVCIGCGSDRAVLAGDGLCSQCAEQRKLGLELGLIPPLDEADPELRARMRQPSQRAKPAALEEDVVEAHVLDLGRMVLAHPRCPRCNRPAPAFTIQVCERCAGELAALEEERAEQRRQATLRTWRRHGHIYRQREVEKGRRGPGSGSSKKRKGKR